MKPVLNILFHFSKKTSFVIVNSKICFLKNPLKRELSNNGINNKSYK